MRCPGHGRLRPPGSSWLALLTLDEAHDLPRLLQAVAQEAGPASPDAGRLAREIAARIPSEN
ncbi:DUF6417 family protein [Streptomyces umbrinus]|uniref:DUF6417 family protein n=1 Tax=Streptomyces umbrinus TaxID=67370 RepID=UPI0033F913E3